MKKHLSTILLFLVFFAGLSLLIYPSFSDWWNRNKATNVIANYDAVISKTDDSAINHMWAEADAYNRDVANNFTFLPEGEILERYYATMDASGTGIIGYVEIPLQKISLPIYHGTDNTILQVAIGHLEWSSLPTGQPGTHVVISGHRGLPSARLFTDIDQMVEGDLFRLEVLNKEFTYQVDNISIVLPEEMEFLKIEPEQSYCTLVTCTPYGVNSHRLLIRGHLIDNLPGTIRVTADAIQIRPVQVAPFIAAPMLLVLLILLFTSHTDVEDFDDDSDNRGGIFRA